MNWKRFAHGAGTVLALVGIVFVVVQLRRYGASVDLGRVPPREWLALACLVVFGVGMNGCLGMAWWNALSSGGSAVRKRWAVAIYAMTHVARYVPGNVFHYAGRQAVGMAAGLPGRTLVRASLLELAFVSVAGCLLGLFAAPLAVPELGTRAWNAGVVLLIAAAMWLIRWRLGRALARAFALYLFYLLCSGLTFLVAVLVRAPAEAQAGHDWVCLCAAYIAAWLVGMLTPGAPAGLGVRELVVLFLLHGQIDAPTLVFAVLATRVIAIAADTSAWGAGVLLSRGTPIWMHT